jgi:hypothetical protein
VILEVLLAAIDYKTALNMAGHLLEHHPTTGTLARDLSGYAVKENSPDACEWCLSGALQVVANSLKLDDVKFFSRAYKILGLNWGNAVHKWDSSESNRGRIVKALKEYNGK